MKRPLAFFSVVFIILLFFSYRVNESVITCSPIKSTPEGKKELYGCLQDDTVTLCGTIEDYSYKSNYNQITTELRLKQVAFLLPSEKKLSSRSRIIVYINKEETVSIGNTVYLSGRLSFFEKATNPGEFDEESYYKNKDIICSVRKAYIYHKTEDEAVLRQYLKNFAGRQEELLEKCLTQINAEILKAMLFGDKQGLNREIKTLYQKNGIAHLLAISGLHISLLGMAVFRCLIRFPVPVKVSLGLSGILLILYGFMVGFPVSAFRAICMFSLFLISKITKRTYDMLTALSCSAILQLISHPCSLFDCSFQLSYAAILGIAVLMPALQSITETIRNKKLRKVIQLFIPSLSVSLITLPILIFHYHEFSFYSVLLNVIAVPFMGILLPAAIIMLMAANLCLPLARLLSLPVTMILWVYESGCRLLDFLPAGQRNIPHPSFLKIFLYYAILFCVTVLVKKKRQAYHFVIPIAAVFCLLFPMKPHFSVWMLDVGQGDCNVVFSKEGKTFVIDCGSTSKNKVGEKILIPFLKYHGVNRIDGVFVSHPDEDHMNGVIELLECGDKENIEVARVFLYEKSMKTQPEEWEELRIAAIQNDIPLVGIKQGDCIRTNSLGIACLYPLKEQRGLTGNDASIVLSLTMERPGGEVFRALFTGDLETEGEKIILEEYPFIADYDLLKVGHHGSSSSGSKEFLERISPHFAVISCGENNRYGHPHKETLERLSEENITYFITYKKGALCFW